MPSMTDPTSRVAGEAVRNTRRATIGGAKFALAVLFGMNLLNYVDRYIFFSVGGAITKDLGLTDTGFGLLAGSFMIVYTFVSPLVGVLGDRIDRRKLLAFGVGLWSVATLGTAVAQNYNQMFFWRALLGVGEASYGVIAPALLADLFDARRRGRVMGLFYLALPVGAAIGFVIGGVVTQYASWRASFLVVGFPGLLIALLGLRILDPGRGAAEARANSGKSERPGLSDYLLLFRNRTFLLNTAGMAGVTFATGAFASWGSQFYTRVRGMNHAEASKWLGILMAIAGLVGITMGTWLTDLMLRKTRRAYLIWASIAIAVAVPFGLAGVLAPDVKTSLALLFLSSILMASVLGPCNTVTANVVPAAERAAGYALSIFLVHIFGDISSPILVGTVSDRLGRSAIADSRLATALESVGAVTVDGTNLTAGLLLVIPALVLAVVFFWIGSFFLPRDQARAAALGSHSPHEGIFTH